MEISKGIVSVLCAFTAASSAISIGSAVATQIDNPKDNTLMHSEYYSEFESEAFYANEPAYILREHEGNIGVFNTDGKLLEIFEVSVVTLPMSERQKLNSGITVKGESELNKLKEAYCG